MAINPNTQYPGKIATPDANYPYGGAQNISAPGDGTGTPWEKALVNDLFGMQQALLKSAGIVPSGAADKVGASQYLQAMVEMISGRSTNYTASGTNTITLTTKTDQEGPQGLYIGLTVDFIAVATNTGAMSLAVNGLTVKSLRKASGVLNMASGDIVSGRPYKAIYDGVVFRIANDPAASFIRDINNNYEATTVEDALTDLLKSGGWTPTFEGETSAGTGWSYFFNTGNYRRVGKLTYINVTINLTAGAIGAGASGNLMLKGLDSIPGLFHTSSSDWFNFNVEYNSALSLTTGHRRVSAERHNTDSDAIIFKEYADNGTFNLIQVSQIVSLGFGLTFGMIIESEI